jgi:HPr kinase/phosphorylase
MHKILVEKLLEEKGAEFEIERLTGCVNGMIPITVSDVNRPGLLLAGFTQNFLFERIQIVGETEHLYLSTLSEEDRSEAIGRLMKYDLPVIIFTKSLPVPPVLLKLADERHIPVLRTPLSTTPFIHRLTSYLDDEFAPQTTIHGSLVDVYGVGMLIMGKSGIGKSECALDLVERGHRLVADDMVIVTRTQKGFLIGTSNENLGFHMEIRGIGIIDVQRMFGIRAIRPRKKIELGIDLQDWGAQVEYDRLGLDETTRSILGVKIPVVTVPINPGKNITVIAEVVALNQLLKEQGFHAAEQFNANLLESMRSKLPRRPGALRPADGLD